MKKKINCDGLRKTYVLTEEPKTGWSKSLCAPDDYNYNTRCAKTFWSLCI